MQAVLYFDGCPMCREVRTFPAGVSSVSKHPLQLSPSLRNPFGIYLSDTNTWRNWQLKNMRRNSEVGVYVGPGVTCPWMWVHLHFPPLPFPRVPVQHQQILRRNQKHLWHLARHLKSQKVGTNGDPGRGNNKQFLIASYSFSRCSGRALWVRSFIDKHVFFLSAISETNAQNQYFYQPFGFLLTSPKHLSACVTLCSVFQPLCVRICKSKTRVSAKVQAPLISVGDWSTLLNLYHWLNKI